VERRREGGCDVALLPTIAYFVFFLFYSFIFQKDGCSSESSWRYRCTTPVFETVHRDLCTLADGAHNVFPLFCTPIAQQSKSVYILLIPCTGLGAHTGYPLCVHRLKTLEGINNSVHITSDSLLYTENGVHNGLYDNVHRPVYITPFHRTWS